MYLKLEIPDYDNNAIDVVWEQNSKYEINIQDGQIVLNANNEALISFAKQMLYFAYNNDIKQGAHVHFGSFLPGVENSKNELVIEKTNL